MNGGYLEAYPSRRDKESLLKFSSRMQEEAIVDITSREELDTLQKDAMKSEEILFIMCTDRLNESDTWIAFEEFANTMKATMSFYRSSNTASNNEICAKV